MAQNGQRVTVALASPVPDLSGQGRRRAGGCSYVSDIKNLSCGRELIIFVDYRPQDPQSNDEYNYNYGDDYGDEYYGYDENPPEEYEESSLPDEDSQGVPEYDPGAPEAARWDSGQRNDPCRGVVCPEIDCPTRPYIPQGECCPICPGQSQAAPVRPNLQVI